MPLPCRLQGVAAWGVCTSAHGGGFAPARPFDDKLVAIGVDRAVVSCKFDEREEVLREAHHRQRGRRGRQQQHPAALAVDALVSAAVGAQVPVAPLAAEVADEARLDQSGRLEREQIVQRLPPSLRARQQREPQRDARGGHTGGGTLPVVEKLSGTYR